MDVVSDFGVKELSTRPNKFLERLVAEHPEFFTVEFTDIKKMKKVAAGQFGTVFKALYQGEKVAVKRLDFVDRKHYKYLVREIQNLRQVDHPYILKYVGVAHDQYREVYLVTEFVDGATMTTVCKKIRKKYDVILDFAIKLALCMLYLNHFHNMVHRDIKLDNVMISEDMQTIKLCDFGLSYKQGQEEESEGGEGGAVFERKMTCVGSGNFMAPEMVKGIGGFASDIYSFGVMIGTLLGYPRRLKKKFDRDIFMSKSDKNAPDELRSMVLLCVREDPLRRPSFESLASGLIHLRRAMYPHLPDIPQAEKLLSDCQNDAPKTSQTTDTPTKTRRNATAALTLPPKLRRSRSFSDMNMMVPGGLS